ncbi:ParB/RepB/Spo0J family partition protein, partial [Lachnospira eligens]|uniref:ParB/RepB/Spo0J family partition protein n=1 Tax=Lachnospira eligens TaxID=39485 RepID=UPI0018A06238
MPKLNNFFDKTETVEKILTKKMHPQLVSINKLEESKLQYRDIPQEDVEKLADLIELDGEVLQPLLVRKAGGDTYEILAGHKRYRACRYLTEKGLEQFSMIPCYVKAMSDAQAEFAVYSTNGYNRKTDYEIMREVEGMSRLLKENPELFPEAASGRLVEKLASIMNMSKTVVQEYKTIANNLSSDAMEKFKKDEITKESAKTLAALNNEEQAKVLSTGAVKTNEIKQAVAELKEPSNKDIELAYHHITSGLNMKKYVPGSVFENYLKDRCGRTHQYYGGTGLSFDCSLRGVAINRRKEITWHDFVSRAEKLGLYKPYDYVTESVTKNEPEEQLPGQDSILNHPEYLPDDNAISDN